jgi:uncharacterized protein (TIGR04376 family)
MGLFEDLSHFLETRIDEFLKNNPHLELQALDEKLREQERETNQLLLDLRGREKQVENQILAIAQEIQRWHVRIQKAQAAGRLDLAEPAQAHEAALIRQGNQLWGHMEILKDRINQTDLLLPKIKQRRQEVQAQLAQVQAARSVQAQDHHTWTTTAWSNSYSPKAPDPLEEKFVQWESEDELHRMRRDIGH